MLIRLDTEYDPSMFTVPNAAYPNKLVDTDTRCAMQLIENVKCKAMRMSNNFFIILISAENLFYDNPFFRE